MQAGIIVRLFIASPSDVAEERDAIVRGVMEWNAVHSLGCRAIVEAVRIETHVQAALGNHPQELINRQLLDRCDLLVAVFWSRLGTPTNKKQSGTLHEIADFVRRKGRKNALLLFSERDYPRDIDTNEVDRLRTYREEMKSQGLYIQYKDTNDFHSVFQRQLQMAMNELLVSDEAKKCRDEPLAEVPALLAAQDKRITELEKQVETLKAIERFQESQLDHERGPKNDY